MKFCTLIVTRSKSCSVKTLHTILKMNIHCIQQSVQNEILYVNDDPFEKAEMIKRCISRCDRLFFIDFGINVDEESIKQMFQPHEGVGVLVFPGVKIYAFTAAKLTMTYTHECVSNILSAAGVKSN